MHRVWRLPLNTYIVLIPLISNRLPLCVDLYPELPILSESDLVSFVTRHAVWFGRMSSPLGRNAFHCCYRLYVHLDKLFYDTPRFVYDFDISKIDNESSLLVYSFLELIFVRSGSFSLSKDC